MVERNSSVNWVFVCQSTASMRTFVMIKYKILLSFLLRVCLDDDRDESAFNEMHVYGL